ncbi:ephexin-1 isoform X2 [Oryzias melastigma]|uniref:Neuronal guanine nucleotide exchange factor n=1 Tax=Oryzias melastigma TaxID=30732 RepID=A0A3B3B5E2_ORYME|nr:ephexin-1 isoform X2 [Oryzias melastigma]
MSVIALFRNKWGQKAQDAPSKQRVAEVLQSSRNEEDEDEDSATGFSREPIRRNSRFYRSMRKKKTAGPTEQTDSSGVEHRAGAPSHQKPPLLSVDRQASPQQSPRLHHFRAPLPSNGEARSRQASSNRDAVDRTGGVGGGMRVDKSAASISQHKDFTTDLPSYRTHNFHNPAASKLPEQRSSTWSIQEKIGQRMDSQQPSSNEADRHNANHRLLRNGESPQTALHSLNLIKSVAFLYQEYRDTSKQQEIEQRRQQENLYPGSKGETEAEAGGSTSQPALQLQLRNSAHSLSLWQNLEAVQSSGLLSRLSQNEIIMQEAMFELVTSEASYYKSLEILETHFLHNPNLINTLSQSDMHFLFSNIEEVMEASERFLMDLEHRIEEAILISDVCDIVSHHAEKHFKVFITYVINQVYQEKTYRRILEENQAFRETMAALEKHPCVRGLSFTSFLILPFQRITRLKLLVQNILKTAEEHSERETNAIKAHQQLEQIVQECNEGVRKMSRTEELISIEKTLEFKSKSVPIISHSRWLLKKGEVQLMCGPKSTRTMRSRKLYQPVCLFLFNNLLLITKRSGDKFQVLDSCTRAMLRTEDLEDQGQQLAFVFNLKMLENQEDRTVTYMIKTSSTSDKLRWICALTPNRRTRFTSAGSQQSDSPQVQCIQSYTAQESDEISIEMADVLNLLERTNDGWMMGERLHDGEKGWFPSRVVEEIHSKEVRAQNLREAYRVQQAHDSGGGPQVGSKSGIRAGRRVGKGLDFSSRWSESVGDSSEGTQ